MRKRASLLTATAIAAALGFAGSAVAAPAGAAPVDGGPAPLIGFCEKVYTPPSQSGNVVRAFAYWVCDNPQDPRAGQPLGVALQFWGAGPGEPLHWIQTGGGIGEARHVCPGTVQTWYRTLQRPDTTVRVFNCSPP